jgi:hypothetical protein
MTREDRIVLAVLVAAVLLALADLASIGGGAEPIGAPAVTDHVAATP